MVDRLTSAQRLGGIFALWSAAIGTFLGAGCGVQGHPQPLPFVPGSGGAVAFGSGGQSQVITGSGGQSAGTGGQSSGTGGQTQAGSGGVTLGGTGGRSAGTGGQPAGSGGSSSGSGGNTVVSGAGIMINGTFVPKEKAIVFIHFGHSNMRGLAMNPASEHSYFYDTQPGLWSYQGGTTFVLAKEPTAPEGNIMAAGPGTALLKTAAAAASSSGGYQFISIGKGVSSDTTADYQKTIGGAPGANYDSFITKKAMMLKGKVTFGAVFIMLGITERHLPTAQQSGYPMRVQQIVSDIRADLGEPNLPILYCDYEQNALGPLAPNGSVGLVIMPMTRTLPGLIKYLQLVPTDMIPRADYEDDHHFNMTGHEIWATQAIGIMTSTTDVDHPNGWFPWK